MPIMIAQILLCGLILSCTCVPIPNILKKCDKGKADFNECLKTAFEDALSKSTSPVKEIGLVVIDPMVIPSFVIGAGSGAVAFQQNYKNVEVSGLSKCKCNKVEMDFSGKSLKIDCDFPVVRMDFHYEINGKILLLPIFGKGPGFIQLERTNLDLTFDLNEYEKRGKKHFKVVKTKLIFTPQLIKFQLDNLFDGDKALGENINQVLNDNWSEVFADVKTSYEDAYGQFFAAIFNNVLGKVSESELFGGA